MPFPPAALPVNLTNATPQQNTHPNLHNQTSQAVNDTVAQLQALIPQIAASYTFTLTNYNSSWFGQRTAAGNINAGEWGNIFQITCNGAKRGRYLIAGVIVVASLDTAVLTGGSARAQSGAGADLGTWIGFSMPAAGAPFNVAVPVVALYDSLADGDFTIGFQATADRLIQARGSFGVVVFLAP